ncbi:hypothetical protein [Escherichia coli]|uniref:hypothetical protein n=1 Tax=Escherichia coli TaxID=562 RepID=UPI001985CDD4|nr:hypothetical protein [Escherichia coli]CAD5736596.1 Uncharacterised protein [Escherichia coli]
MSFLSFLRKISNKEKEIFISEERFFSLLERVSAFDVVREWAENGGAYYPLLECRRLTDIEDVRKSEDILNRLEFIDRRFQEFISIMSEYNRNDKSKDKWERELSEYSPEKIYRVRREGDHLSLKNYDDDITLTEIPPWLRCRLLSAKNALLRKKWMSYMLCLKD